MSEQNHQKKKKRFMGFSEEDLERPPERTLVLVPVLDTATNDRLAMPDEAVMSRSIQARMEEACGLARAIDLNIIEAHKMRVKAPKPATLLGSGKVEELAQLCHELEIGLVFVDHALTPVQQRNLEQELHAKVMDRTGLILEIFAARAQTKEGRLQVELAHLTYQKSRLVRSWTHLERQRGGVGFMGGPGETQIEADRRMIQVRINSLKADLEKVRQTRGLHRSRRQKVPHPVVALVGYTNAGKSTLFNRITKADVLAQDMLFATLDPTMRRLNLPKGTRVILSDTVGFVSDLPTTLVAAFRATLEEVIEAELILHVRDVSHDDFAAQGQDVENILSQLGVKSGAKNLVEVWNKTDQLSADDFVEVQKRRDGSGNKPMFVSAVTGEGISELLALVEGHISAGTSLEEVRLAPHQGSISAWLYKNGTVIERKDHENGDATLQVRLSLANAAQLRGKLQKEAAG